MYVDSQRVHTVDQNVYAQVVLQVLDQVRLVNVVLDYPACYTFFVLGSFNMVQYPLLSARKKYAFALR